MLNATWGCIKKTRHLLKWPQITFFVCFLLSFFSRGELPVDKKCEISSFLWVWKHPWSRVNKCHLLFFISFHRLSFCIHFLSCSFHFAFISFHFALMSFHVPSLRCYVSKIQVFESWYAQTGQVGIRPNARVFFFIFRYRFCYRLAIVFEAYAGCHLQASWTCTCISSLSFFFYSYRLLGRQCIGSVKVQAKRKWNARGYETIPLDGFVHLKLITSWVGIVHH